MVSKYRDILEPSSSGSDSSARRSISGTPVSKSGSGKAHNQGRHYKWHVASLTCGVQLLVYHTISYQLHFDKLSLIILLPESRAVTYFHFCHYFTFRLL